MSDDLQVASFGKKFSSALKFFFFVIVARILSICALLLALLFIVGGGTLKSGDIVFICVLCAIGIALFIFSRKMKEAHELRCPNCYKWNALDYSYDLESTKDVSMKKAERHLVFDKSPKKPQPKPTGANSFIGRADTSDPNFHIEKTYSTVAGVEKTYNVTKICKYCGEVFTDRWTSRKEKK